MNRRMFSPRQLHKVLDSIIHRVLIDVVNDSTNGPRPVGILPDDHRSRTPHVRLRYLDPRPGRSSSRPVGHVTDLHHVVRPLSLPELSRFGYTLALLQSVTQVPRDGGTALVRAEASGLRFAQLPVEVGATVLALPCDAARPALTRAEEPFGPPSDLGRATFKCGRAGEARQRRHRAESTSGTGTTFAGTGTTLCVADLHHRDAIGIDLDPGNPDLYPYRFDEVRKALFGTQPELAGQASLFENC